MNANGVVQQGSVVEIQIDDGDPQKILIIPRNAYPAPAPPPGVSAFSVDAPVPKGILGAKEGDEVSIITPGGARCVRVLSIDPPEAVHS